MTLIACDLYSNRNEEIRDSYLNTHPRDTELDKREVISRYVDQFII